MSGPLIFLGTGDFAVPLLRALNEAGERIALVVTQPERPRGRGRKPAPTPVAEEAARLGLPVETPENVNDPAFVERMKRIGPEFLALADYGQLLREPVLLLAPGGPVNLHPSLLPRWRGPAPMAWPIIAGEEETGVSVMLMDKGMDTGPVLAQEKHPIEPGTTEGELAGKLATAGARLFVGTLRGMRLGEVKPRAQDPALATLSKMAPREWQTADFTLPAKEFANRVNGLSPKPGVRATIEGRMVKLLRAREGKGSGEPGEVLAVGKHGITVAAGSGAVDLLELLPEGGKRVKAGDWANSGAVARGMKFAPWTPKAEPPER